MEARNFICHILLISFLLPTTAFTSLQCDATGNGNRLEKKNEVKTVLMLGNSITFSPRWEGVKGMAASIKDSDYVHLLARDIHQIDPSVVINYGNIAEFERDFDTYPLSKLADSLKYIAKITKSGETYPLQPGFESIRNPDMFILKISENVNDEKAMQKDFIKYNDSLIKYVCPDSSAVMIIVDGFWENRNLNRLLEEYAFKKKYPFVSISNLSKDSTNMAIGKFDDKGVASHPSDKGMRLIERQIWEKIKSYFGDE